MKSFEDYFSEIQTDMIDICLEYANDKLDYVFIYCCCEKELIASNFFYGINKCLLKKNKLNDSPNKNPDNSIKYDTSIERQKKTLTILNQNILKIEELFKENGKEAPTEIKIIYDNIMNKMEAEYQYIPIISNSETLTDEDVFNTWFNEIKQSKKYSNN